MVGERGRHVRGDRGESLRRFETSATASSRSAGFAPGSGAASSWIRKSAGSPATATVLASGVGHTKAMPKPSKPPGCRSRRCRGRSASRKTRPFAETSIGARTSGFGLAFRWRVFDASAGASIAASACDFPGRNGGRSARGPERFAVAPGHTAIDVEPGVEEVVKKYDHFWIVEKRGEAGEIAAKRE